MTTFSRLSSDTVRESTTRDWAEWVEVLDAAGARDWKHAELVAHLERAHPEVPSGWWRQSVAVGYEQATGQREVGETSAGGFQIGVQRTTSLPLDAAWDLLTSRPDLWLGGPVAFEKGAVYEVPGARGEIRVVRPGSRLRLTWQPDDWAAPATLQLTVSQPREGRTVLHVHLEKLPDAASREQMREHWRAVLDRLVAEAG